ncbi:Zinc finger CCCH domain-containing protein 39 [Heracleum sosnowskyi]|uniref:Zinc finger CCCH domain-containing protein 39 n=1 Tax=Heracleum sosnowskyi TaxID=360622 RepID=A0AAD8JG02_9APIA|nr:Zinc finger CCCH domain-containing protein 39 [Heracleum sosnowskyi]
MTFDNFEYELILKGASLALAQSSTWLANKLELKALNGMNFVVLQIEDLTADPILSQRMSYPVPPSPRHMHAGNVHLGPPSKESAGSGSQHGHAPPFKRARSQYELSPDSAYFIPTSSRTSQSRKTPLINKLSGNIFYKTRLCEKFVGGNCSNGEKCTFAHGSEDLHEPPPNWKEYVTANGRRGRKNRGMKLCKNSISEKECPYGEKCKFLHRVPCNTEVARPLPINISSPSTETTGPTLGQTRLNKHLACSDALVVNRKLASFKTKMCTKWEITGQCPFEERCHFAHGHSELQVPGAQTEAEIITDVHPFPKKALLQLVNDALPTKAEATQGRVNNEVPPWWKMSNKISRIYGDWLEDLTPPEKLLP